MVNSVSAERSLAGGIFVSLLIAAVVSRWFPQLSFGSFGTMFLILIGGNVAVYLLSKLGLFKSSGSV